MSDPFSVIRAVRMALVRVQSGPNMLGESRILLVPNLFLGGQMYIPWPSMVCHK